MKTLFHFELLPHVSVILNRFIERRTALMPTLISIPSIGFVISSAIVLVAAYLTKFYKSSNKQTV